MSYEFPCSCDTDLKFMGRPISSPHLITREREHLNLADSRKNAIKEHIKEQLRSTTSALVYKITIVLLPCLAIIHKALLVKHHGSSRNKQCYGSGASFLLNTY